MKQVYLFLLSALFLSFFTINAQEKNQPKFKMNVENIMRDEKWIGHPPSNPFWSDDGKTIYFMWNPDNAKGDSLYKVSKTGGIPVKVAPDERNKLDTGYGVFNKNKSEQIVEKGGNIFLRDVKSGKERTLISTTENKSNVTFTHDEKKITFIKDNKLFYFNLESAELIQLTDFRSGSRPSADRAQNAHQAQTPQAKFLAEQQMKLFDFLKNRRNDFRGGRRRRMMSGGGETVAKPLEIYLQDKIVSGQTLSPDERYVTFRLMQPPKDVKNTIITNYVTASGYTEEVNSRSKVGGDFYRSEFGIYDLKRDTVYYLQPKELPGIFEYPKYLYEYPKEKPDESVPRDVSFQGPYYSPDGKYCVVTARSLDNKDKWIVKVDLETGKLTSLFRERNEAWIDGPGAYSFGWMPDNKSVWFQSEIDGYAHIYTANVETGDVKQLTKGKFEVYSPQISKDKKSWYFTSNEVHPGERNFYRMPINGGTPERITSLTGNNDCVLSPDEKNISVIYSYTNKPPELYVMENKKGAEEKQVTSSLTDEFKSYPWRDPEVITFKAEDGATVYARLYRPENGVKNGAGVIFVHGAGYLQNAHKWWSEYPHEYMFNNLLADEGFTVMDIDYRGSAGYGRDWRTGIYRHMGGKDLSDNVDGAKYMVENCGVDAKRIGIYGGSYGGFMTLMAMFTKPGVFAAGAALRSVTDWAHYNHGYTANILNVPYLDSLAYVRSSPIYFAEGLQGALLMCHGVMDDNVHFQDIVRLTERLIELGKDNWDLAIYPIESHGFTDPKSWTDEYKRIHKLFLNNLLKK